MLRYIAAALITLTYADGSFAQSATKFPKPIIFHEIEVVPTIARVEKVPLTTFSGASQSKDPLFIFVLRLNNRSSTKRIDFEGWPSKTGFTVNCSATDEYANKYKAVRFGIARPTLDEAGETIEPNGKRVAIVVFEKPIPNAGKFTISLDGSALGYDGEKMVWEISRTDWEQAGQK